MPLQIRRGTETERTNLGPSNGLVVGELLYVTSTDKIYIGTGRSGEHQGIVVTGYTDIDSVNAVGTALAAGTSTNIAFTYTSTSIDASVDLSNYSGTITADAFRGSLYGDDTSLLIDGILGRVLAPVFADVTGNVTGDVTGNLNGNVTGNVTGNITGDVTGNTTGYHLGDVKGSVVGDDSTLLVDSVSGILRTSSLVLSDNTISATVETMNIGTNSDPVSPLTIRSGVNGLRLYGLQDSGNAQGVVVTTYQARGTLSAPTAVDPSDFLHGGASLAHNGTDYVFSGSYGFIQDSAIAFTSSSTSIPSFFAVQVPNASNVSNELIFNSAGVLSVPILKVAEVSGTLPSPAEAGMIVLDGGTFKGYNGSAWVTLG